MTRDEIEDWIEERALEWGVNEEEVRDFLDEVDLDPEEFGAYEDVPTDELGRPDPEYMMDLADELDLDVSDLYDMYYGYAPGSHGGD